MYEVPEFSYGIIMYIILYMGFCRSNNSVGDKDSMYLVVVEERFLLEVTYVHTDTKLTFPYNIRHKQVKKNHKGCVRITDG
jgi:hypothetical protein